MAKNRAEAEAVSRKLNEEKESMKGVAPATEEEVRELSRKMNACMVENKQGHWRAPPRAPSRLAGLRG